MVTLEDLNPDPPDSGAVADEAAFVSLAEAGQIVETLGSATRRSMVVALSEEPRNAASLAREIDTTVQNATYHLDQLQEAGLVTVVGTHYSEKGSEMDVYAPTSASIVIDVEPPAIEAVPVATGDRTAADGTGGEGHAADRDPGTRNAGNPGTRNAGNPADRDPDEEFEGFAEPADEDRPRAEVLPDGGRDPVGETDE